MIKHYSFSKLVSLGVEAKSLDFLWHKAGWTGELHRTDFYHFLWVERGELQLQIDFQTICLRSGDAVVISPHQVCRFSPSSRPQGYSVLFVPESLGESPSDLHLLSQVSSACVLGQRVVSLDGLPISGLIRQLMAELGSDSDGYQFVIVRSCLRILLAEVARRMLLSFGKMDGLAERFVREVEVHCRSLYNVRDYLSLLSARAKSLTEAVRSSTGLTPKSYLDQRRIIEIKRLLLYSDLSVKEIAFVMGFEEPSNFNKFFRKHTLISPSDFREQEKGKI